jgi:hypothetical protein
MIPYDELVSALAEWRARQGLGGGSVAAPVRATRSAPVAAAPVPAAPVFAAPAAPVLPGRQSAPYAAAAAASASVLDDFEEGGEGTEIRDGLGDEIDVDAEAVDVIEEEHLEDE